MTKIVSLHLAWIVAICVVSGCTGKPPVAQISGTVTFKGNPIPAGNVMFTPDVSIPGGQIKMFMVKDGKYDSATEPNNGLPPGQYKVTISGYDGKQIPRFFQGKQIFNSVDETMSITAGKITKDFVVPDSAGVNVKLVETADF